MTIHAERFDPIERTGARRPPAGRRADGLAGLGLFADLTLADRAALLDAAGSLTFDKGDAIRADGQGDDLIVLQEGIAALGIDDDGRRAVLAVVSAPQVLNLACVMAGTSPLATWRAAERCRVLFVPHSLFLGMVSRDPCLAAKAAATLANDYQDLVATAAAQRLRCAQERLADFLLSLSAGASGCAEIRLPYSKHLLASLLGMTPENLSRTMAALGPFGVSVQGADIRIADRQSLRAAVGRLGASVRSGP